jgi:16S rRNA (uracil1498-N3)-methyltransferase
MPATPAWPPDTLPRLFVDQPLAADLILALDGAAANYLGAVLRMKPGAQLKLFDDQSGEWLAEVVEAGRRVVSVRIVTHLRPREAVPDLWLLAAPIKKGRIDWLVEKACELGSRACSRAHPAHHRRPAQPRSAARAHDRGGRAMRAHRLARACRTDPPRRAAPRLAVDRQLIFADEAGGVPIAQIARAGRPRS